MADKARINNAKAQLSESYNALLDHFHATELKVIGNYNVVRLIGQGSFGKVYLATHKFTNTKVVLKSSAKSAPNLVREIHHHRQFKHPHITRLHEIIVTETVVWMVLEYCPGDELYTYLVENGRLSVDETRKIFAQLCGAVTYVHNTKNCVHRDLKLENILLDRHHNVKLCDFGFTRGYESRVMLETICGTSAYMAPEMLLGKKYSGEAVDVWSLGVILYALVCGEMPFDEEDEEDTKNRIMNAEPDYAKHQLPADMLALLKGMLCKNPHQRPKLAEVLNNGFLGLEGMRQAEMLAAKEPKLFSTKMEKHVLKRMKALNISIENLYESVSKMKCDSLAGFWAASLEKAYKKERRKQSRRRSRSAFSYSFDIARKRPSEENIGDSMQMTAPHSPSSPLSKVRHFDGLGIRNRLSGDFRRPSSEQVSTPRQSLDFRPPHRSTTTGEAMTSPPAPDSPRSPRDTATNTPDTSVTLERPHTVGESPRLQASPFDNRSVTSDGSSLKKKGNFGKSLKNVMLKMVFIGKKKPTTEGNTQSEPSQSSGTGRSLPSSLHSYSIKNKSNTSLEEGIAPTETVPDVPPLPQSAPGLTSLNSQDNIEPMTSFRRTTRRERPISQISSFSGISQISGISAISSAPSVSSSLERSGSGSRRIVMRRPYFGRRSTSSSFSSIQSHRKTHSKASSTSSTDEYLGDDTTDPGSPGPSQTPTTSYGRHSTSNKKAHSKQHDYNETAQFNTYKPPSRRRKSATKVSSPNMALFPSRSRPTNSKRPDRKGSVIEEEVEDEYVEESFDGDDGDGLDFDTRGRSF
ncbi:kinase-like domain-containing protein [Yarrowia lipolytica]|nr:kinase-like domain-containing protein [Yarrowia lipolytica]RDW51402.1 kinase-like domain-containing protein [Yarrowia lipolytica]